MVKKIVERPKKKDFFQHETKKHSLNKYLILLGIVVLYLAFTINMLGFENGLLTTLVTWAFFVFCTPIADAGFLLDFPIRLVIGLRMIYSEMLVWVLAGIITISTLFFTPQIYSQTIILELFYHIITNPFPFWAIIIVSAIGTFLSIYFGDELIDVSTHKTRIKYHKHINKYQLVVYIFIIILIIVLYDFLLKQLGVTII